MPRRTVVDPRFPARLRELRVVRGVSLRDLYRRTYISKSTISELEHGIKSPSVATAIALDRGLDAGGELARLVTEPTDQESATEFDVLDDESLAGRALRYHGTGADTVDTILAIGRADVNRRSIIFAPFVAAALAAPSREWLLASLESITDDHGPRTIGPKQVAGIRDMFALFQEMDVMRGGGHARVALVEYMNSYVLPLARRDHGDEQVQVALYEAASEQAYLVGWMAYDDGMHGLAQRYLVQSLRLAQASGNRMLGAHVLAGMSDQANLLGNPHEALSLARAGQRGITINDSPACLADLQILEARAYASLGDAPATAQAVSSAERSFAQVRPADEPEWARFIDPAYLFGEAAHCWRDLGNVDLINRFATDSAREAMRQGRARRGALSHSALAISLILDDQPEAAAVKGTYVVDLATSVNSSRCVEALRDLSRRLQPYAHLPEVEAFNAATRDAGLAV